MTRVAWQATDAHTNPAVSVMTTGEIREIPFDMSAVLGETQTPENPDVSLVRLDTLEVVEDGAALDTPAVEDNVISVKVANVEPGTTYELRVSFDHTNPRVAGERSTVLHIIEGVM